MCEISFAQAQYEYDNYENQVTIRSLEECEDVLYQIMNEKEEILEDLHRANIWGQEDLIVSLNKELSDINDEIENLKVEIEDLAKVF